jgi:hypothetical protein
MTVAAIRTAIKTLMLTVPDIGVVHEYERYTTDMAGVRALYVSVPHNQLRGWFVRRQSTKEVGRIQNRSVEIIRWQIRGFMALDDSAQSELVMDGLVESLRDVFRVNETLSGTVDQCAVPQPGGGSGEAGLQVEDFGPVMFASVLCHHARLGLNTYRYLTAPV